MSDYARHEEATRVNVEARRAKRAERDALAARVEELEARIARADVLLGRARCGVWRMVGRGVKVKAEGTER